jgi:hypothetical protein
VILAKKLERLICRRHTFVDEIIDSRLPCRHADIRSVTLAIIAWRCDDDAWYL